MSLTQRVDTRMRFPGRERVRFSPARLGELLQERVPELDFDFYTRTCREYDQYILEMERYRRLRAETAA